MWSRANEQSTITLEVLLGQGMPRTDLLHYKTNTVQTKKFAPVGELSDADCLAD